MANWWVILIGLLGGVAVGLQAPLAGAMGQRVGGTASSFIIHIQRGGFFRVVVVGSRRRAHPRMAQSAVVYAFSGRLWFDSVPDH